MATQDDDDLKTQTCVDCGETSPPISSNYTLIGAHGWRVTRRTTTDGDFVVEWRCAACWAALKRASSAPAADGGGLTPTITGGPSQDSQPSEQADALPEGGDSSRPPEAIAPPSRRRG